VNAGIRAAGLIALLLAGYPGAPAFAAAPHDTTAGAIAIANLDHQIARASEEDGLVELLLARSRFLGDYDALERAVAIAGHPDRTGPALLRAAQVHAAEHRFAQALEELASAGRAGADPDTVAATRASILVATGRAAEVIAQLEQRASADPGYAARSALAIAYAGLGRYEDADALYQQALADLDTTAPFPYAWLYFARGLMWAEQAGDRRRGETFYAQALACLPEFAVANIHMAEIEMARGDLQPAMARLERVLAVSQEPEAMALRGSAQMRMGDVAQGRLAIEAARVRYEALLSRHPLAFADHAAEFYLGPGHNAERAWELALQNLANRETPRALSLAIAAARSAGHPAQGVLAQAKTLGGNNAAAP
jgi:tetratricopeptide (TPR) repeat protein